MGPTYPVFELVVAMVGLLTVAGVVLAFCKQFKLPFTVTLVVVGIGLSHLLQFAPEGFREYFNYKISSELILFVCLPTLIFESALHLNARELQRNIIPVLALAIPGLLVSTFLIGLIVSAVTPIDFTSALLLGAILSATDPVAVISIFKQLGAPKRLTILVEGESLFNDATSIVAAKLIFAVVIAGAFGAQEFAFGVYHFIQEFFGGIAVGWALALIVGFILGWVQRDEEIEISLTTILAYASFLIAQEVFDVSGVMATVTAGLTMSYWGHARISPSVSRHLEHFWNYLVYVANALIFLMVGLNVNLGALSNALWPLTVVIIAMLISRAAAVYGLVPLVEKLPGTDKISRPYQTVMYWGGLRGAIALAIVLSLDKFQYTDLFIAIVMGAVLFTLIVQGLSIKRLVTFLGLDIPPLSDRLARQQGQLSAKQTALARIPQLKQEGLFSARISDEVQAGCRKEIDRLNNEADELRRQELTSRTEQKVLFIQMLAEEKSLFHKLFADGHLSERAFRQLSYITEVQTDILRYGGDLADLQGIAVTKTPVNDFLIDLFDRVPMFSNLSGRLRSQILARNYEQWWGHHQGSALVLAHLKTEQGNAEVIAPIIATFEDWHQTSKMRLDGIAEQFPEFVRGMQQRLADRLVLHAELDAIHKQGNAGTIPAGVAENLIEEIQAKLYRLRELPSTRIELDSAELLKKVPFLRDIPEAEFMEIAKLLVPRVTPGGEVIIRQGEKDESLFIIMRGVVRVSREEADGMRDLATLMAGDFFGEIALLHGEPRTATCRAVTPCALYELAAGDFARVRDQYPVIKEAVEKAGAARRETHN